MSRPLTQQTFCAPCVVQVITPYSCLHPWVSCWTLAMAQKFKTICWPQTEQLRNQFNPHSVQTQTFTLVSLTKFMLEKCQTRFSNQTDNKQKSELPNRMVSLGFIVRFSVLISMLRTVDKTVCRFAFSFNNKSNSFYIDFLKVPIQTVFAYFNNSVILYFSIRIATRGQCRIEEYM